MATFLTTPSQLPPLADRIRSDLLKATSNTVRTAAVFGDPGAKATIALHIMPMKQPVRFQWFWFDVTADHGESSMHVQAEKATSANDLGKSDDRIVR